MIPSPAPSTQSTSSLDLGAIRAAMARARARLLRDRRPDGSWVAFCDFGPAATGQVLVGLQFVGKLERADAAAAVKYLASQQRDDGSFGAHPFATAGEIGATACVWAGLAAAGLSATDPMLSRARAFVDKSGGLPTLVDHFQHGDLSALFLAMARQVPATALPEPNTLFSLLPPFEHFLERRFNVLMPITLLQTGLILRFLRGEARGGWSPGELLAAQEARRCLEIMDSFQNHDGSWFYGDTYHAAIGLATLRSIGHTMDDPRASRALAFVGRQAMREGDRLWYSIFNTDVWPTAFALRALMASGSLPSDEAVAKGAAWLCDAQIPVPAASKGIGTSNGALDANTWSFQATNQTMPDSDDAGVALAPLGMALSTTGGPKSLLPDLVAKDVRPVIQGGIGWVVEMQNADGGWPAFQHGLPSKKPGPMMTGEMPIPSGNLFDKLRFFLHPPAELGDPSTEDVTGRVLHGLGQLGYTTTAPSVQKAFAFLRHQQMADGSFWGRWVVNYLAGTAWVLRGLAAVGASPEEPWIRRAISFVLAHQNPDGGWGESVASYADPALAGKGASTAGLTGLVLAALVEIGRFDSQACQAAVHYLLAQQQADGSWPAGNELHALVPPLLFYTLPGTELQQPLEALGRYAAALAGRVPEALPDAETEATRARAGQVAPLPRTKVRDRNGRWDETGMRTMLAVGDPLADKVIDEIFKAQDTSAVNALVGQLARMVDPVPSALPPLTHEYLKTSAALPPWADFARIKVAQDLFVRCGWGVGTALFCSSLPQCYAFPEGARVLLYTQGTSRHAWRRIVETAQFVFDVAAEDGLSPTGLGLRAAQKVRLMHAAIRHLVLQQQSWDSTWGVPISQIQLAGTLMSFSVLVIEGLRRIGLEVSVAEADAWVHMWNVVGFVLGVDEELLPRDLDDGLALFDLLRAYWGKSSQGEELTGATLALMKEMLPGSYLDGLPASLLRHIAGDACGDLLGVPAANWTSLLVGLAVDIDGALGRVPKLGPITNLAQRASLDLMLGLHGWAREGKPVTFRIPDALMHAWQKGR